MDDTANDVPTTATPMIDFVKLNAIIPNNGSLNLVLIKGKNDQLTVIYAPKFKGKEEDNVLRPLKMVDTPASLTETFEVNITDLSAKQRIYADDFKVRTEEVSKAIDKKVEDAAKAKTAPARTTGKATAKATSKAQDLLSMPATPAACTSEEKEPENEISDDEPEFGPTEDGSDKTVAAETKTEDDDNDLGFD